MLAARPVSGVLIVAFEERSFFPGDSAVPDGNDPRRFGTEIEFDEVDFERRTGRSSVAPGPPYGDAYLLNFIGRRTRYPYVVDCDGTPQFTWVVDRLTGVRYLGPGKRFDVNEVLARPVTVERRHGGRWGAEEAEAIERCRGTRREADRIEDPAG